MRKKKWLRKLQNGLLLGFFSCKTQAHAAEFYDLQSDAQQDKKRKERKVGSANQNKKINHLQECSSTSSSWKASVQHITASLSSSFKNTKPPLWSLPADYENKLTIISSSFGFWQPRGFKRLNHQMVASYISSASPGLRTSSHAVEGPAHWGG